MIKPGEIQQMSRDFYDLWYLLEIQKMDVDFFVNEFSRKCESKGLKSSDFLNKLTERLPQYKGRWNSSLSEQIKDLPSFEQAERETLRRFKKNEILIFYSLPMHTLKQDIMLSKGTLVIYFIGV